MAENTKFVVRFGTGVGALEMAHLALVEEGYPNKEELSWNQV
jgi:hypothetical protein